MTASAACWASDPTSGSFPSTLWVIVLVSPTGHPQEFKIRATSQQAAIDRLRAIKPAWTLAVDPTTDLPLIHREELLG
jgi:hypothetical protein